MGASLDKRHHLPNGSFRNNADLEHTHQSPLNVLRWKSNAPKVKAIDYLVNRGFDHQHTLREVYKPNLQHCIWLGHATFLIQYGGLNILTDPHFSDRASPLQFVGPKRTTKPALSIEQLPHIDVIVISHDHYDHLDKQSVKKIYLQQTDNPPLILVPLKLGQWLSKQGISTWIELDWWDKTSYKNWDFHAVPVQHFSGRGLKQNNTLWAGWILEYKKDEVDSFKIFFAGDTGYSEEFKKIGKTFGKIDLSMIPIGAYEPRWFMKEVHVNPTEAARIHVDVNSKKSIAMHWGSFILADEEMDAPPKDLEVAKQYLGISTDDFIVVDHGAVIKI